MNNRSLTARSYRRRSLRLESLESRELLSAVPSVSLVAETFKPAFNYTDGSMTVSGTYKYGNYLLPFTGTARPTKPTGTADFSTATLGDFTMTGIEGTGTWTAPYNVNYGTFKFSSGELQGTDNNGKTTGTGTISMIIYGHEKPPHVYDNRLLDLDLTGSFNAATQKFNIHGSDPKYTAIKLNMSGTIVPAPIEEAFNVLVSTPTWTTVPETGALALQVDVNVPGPVRATTSYAAPAATVSIYWADADGNAIGNALPSKINIGWNEASGTYLVTGLPVPPANAAKVLLVPQFVGKTDTVTTPSALLSLPTRPTLSIDDPQVIPTPATPTTPASLTATFHVTLSEASAFPVTVAYATANGTAIDAAIAGTDYTAAAKTLTFKPGDPLSQTVAITVKPNPKATGDRRFSLNLKNLTWATFANNDSQGVCTITPYAHPTVSINDVLVIPTPATPTTPATLTASFEVRLSAPSPFNVTVAYATANGTAINTANRAIAGTDYTAVTKTLTFKPGDPLVQTVNIAVKPNAKATGDKLFTVNLSNPVWTAFENNDSQGVCTIRPYAHPSVSIDSPQVTRPQTGSVKATFHLTLSASTPFPVTVTYATSNGIQGLSGNGAAVSGSDYTAVSKTVTFPANTTVLPILVDVKANSKSPTAEDFYMNLKSAVWATIAVNKGTCTISPYTPPPQSSLLQPLASYFGATGQRKNDTTILPTVLDAILATSGV